MMRLFVTMDLNWLKDELAKPGRSQSALARFMGVDHPAIVNRIVNGTRRIKAEEADQIRAYLSVTASGKEPQAPEPQQMLRMLPVLGVVEAGAWREVSDITVLDRETIPVVSSRMFEGDTYALKVAGNSMNRFYPDGSYVVVRRWDGGALPIGKRVVVERERDGLQETTVKELVRTAEGDLELWPRSDDPRHQAPLVYGGESVTIRIVGRVIASLSFED